MEAQEGLYKSHICYGELQIILITDQIHSNYKVIIFSLEINAFSYINNNYLKFLIGHLKLSFPDLLEKKTFSWIFDKMNELHTNRTNCKIVNRITQNCKQIQTNSEYFGFVYKHSDEFNYESQTTNRQDRQCVVDLGPRQYPREVRQLDPHSLIN